MLGKVLVVIGVLSTIVLLYVLNYTSPSQAGVMGVLAVFLLFYITSAVVLTFLLYGASRVMVRAFFAHAAQRYNRQFSLKRSYYYGSVLALGPVMLMSLQSVGRGGVQSLTLVITLLILGLFYVSRQTSQ